MWALDKCSFCEYKSRLCTIEASLQREAVYLSSESNGGRRPPARRGAGTSRVGCSQGIERCRPPPPQSPLRSIVQKRAIAAPALRCSLGRWSLYYTYQAVLEQTLDPRAAAPRRHNLAVMSVYVANRGLWISRVARAGQELGLAVSASYSEDDADGVDPNAAAAAIALEPFSDKKVRGPSAYLNIPAVIDAAKRAKADFVHPGVGLLSESSEFARACAANGLVFVGPSVDCLETFGDKQASCALAEKLGIPTLSRGVVREGGTSLTPEQLSSFPLLFKASNGGGGLGHRIVRNAEEARAAYERSWSEASRAFGASGLVVLAEAFLPSARHIEVQILGDGTGDVVALGTRECSVQRRFQKLIEVAPAPNLSQETRRSLESHASKIVSSVKYKGAGTVEFLVDAENDSRYFFIEVNPRLQVEHTVTEEVYGVDIVATQLKIAAGKSLKELNLIGERAKEAIEIRSKGNFAIQCRVNAEDVRIMESGIEFVPNGPGKNRLLAWDLPRGRNVRIETAAFAGYAPNLAFDSLLSLVVVSTKACPDFATACRSAARSLRELRVHGLNTTAPLCRVILESRVFQEARFTTQTLEMDQNLLKTLRAELEKQTKLAESSASALSSTPLGSSNTVVEEPDVVYSPMQATLLSVHVAPGDRVVAGKTLLCVVVSLKMEHEIVAQASGNVSEVFLQPGAHVEAGAPLFRVQASTSDTKENEATASHSSERVENPGLVELKARVESTLDSFRPKKTKRSEGRLTARQLLERSLDETSSVTSVEYGRLATNFKRLNTPGDGFLVVAGHVNASPTMVMAYDYTVLAGTQGFVGHKKKDRAFHLAKEHRLHVLLFSEGGGGRAAGPNDPGGFIFDAGLGVEGFKRFADLRVNVPGEQRGVVVGAVSGFSFAGNAALLGCCDVIVATKSASIGMGGPAMIEGGGLGVVKPEDVGPALMHAKNGLVDVLVDTDEELCVLARRLLDIFQNPLQPYVETRDAEELAQRARRVVPSNRKRAFDMREAIRAVLDSDSFIELKPMYGRAAIVGVGRINGVALGVIANDCRVLSGAIDGDASQKLGDFLVLCESFGLPIVSMCDTPGFLVGVEAERGNLVKRAGDLFVKGAALQRSKLYLVVVRRAYGLGAMAMSGGHLKIPALSIAWPTSEFGAMGFEGAVRLAMRKEIADDPALFDQLVEQAYQNGRGFELVHNFEIDDVIDPAETRERLTSAFYLMNPNAYKSMHKRSSL